MRKNIFGIVLTGLLVTLILGYGFFRFYSLISGPSLSIVSPAETEIVTSNNFIDISLEHKRLTGLTLQGERQDINASGLSNYRRYLSEGNNTITLVGCDQYSNCKEVEIFVFKRSG